MANFELLDKAVKLTEQGFTAEQINKIIDEDIKRISDDKKPPEGDDEKKAPEGDEEKKPPDGDEENKPTEDDENKKRVKELEEQLKKAQEKARRTGDDSNPEDNEKKAYDTLLSKVKNY